MVTGSEENVDELRQRLEHMKKLMAERKLLNGENENRSESGGFIDGSLLSFVFGSALCVILTVSCYAFVNLFHAIAKKYTSSHDEL